MFVPVPLDKRSIPQLAFATRHLISKIQSEVRDYQNLQVRIASVCEGDPPSGSSVTGACVHISDIANDAENRQVIEWDAANDVLDIRDPYLLFFLRWADWK